MYVAVMPQTIVESDLSQQTFKPSKKRGLVASWSMVNGKLVCKWTVIEIE